MIFLGAAIALVGEDWQLGSEQYTMITVYYNSKQYTVIKQICVCLCVSANCIKCKCMLKLSEGRADFQTYPQRITLMQL